MLFDPLRSIVLVRSSSGTCESLFNWGVGGARGEERSVEGAGGGGGGTSIVSGRYGNGRESPPRFICNHLFRGRRIMVLVKRRKFDGLRFSVQRLDTINIHHCFMRIACTDISTIIYYHNNGDFILCMCCDFAVWWLKYYYHYSQLRIK